MPRPGGPRSSPILTGVTKVLRIAFQGTEGAYSEEASLRAFPEAETIGLPTFHQVFAAVTEGEVDLGVVPVENTTAGIINQTYDLLLETDLHVVGELVLKVDHCLLAPPGTRLEDVRKVISHPQGLAQCDGFIARYKLEAIPVYDTAGAARALAENPEPGLAAIASRRAAERYGLVVLAKSIQDFIGNYTRFFVLSREEWPRREGPYKTSVVFTTRHRPGELLAALKAFADQGINLTKLESRPRRNPDRPFSPIFYADFEGHAEDPGPSQALLTLLRRASFVKVLGSYPAVTSWGLLKDPEE
ncbi:prephenate dehydratase [Meiothermus sp. QL-1]|nr:prephenate dehydratase [Meiothermus sp. QL-1]